jgi:hypothetical protein
MSDPDAQRIQSMTRDLASLGQEVEQLKAGIAQLKASQEQMSRDLAKAAAPPPPRPRIAPPPPRPASAPVRRPVASYPPLLPPAAPAVRDTAAASAQPSEPPGAGQAPDAEPVPRPPLPMR